MDYDKLLAEVDSDDEQSRPEPVQTASTDPSPPRPASQEARQAAAQGLLGEIKYEENNLEKLLSVLDQVSRRRSRGHGLFDVDPPLFFSSRRSGAEVR